MFLFDISAPWMMIVLLVFVGLLIVLSKINKTSMPIFIGLCVFLLFIIVHSVIFFGVQVPGLEEAASKVRICLIFDLAMIVLCYVAYIWMDELEARSKKTKSIIDADWLWKKV